MTSVHLSKWMSDCCLMANNKLFTYIKARPSYIWWDDDGRWPFCTKQQAKMDFYNASSLKQHLSLYWHIKLIPSQPIFPLTRCCWVLSGEAIKSLVWLNLGLKPTIFRGWDKHANHYTTNAIFVSLWRDDLDCNLIMKCETQL